MNLLTAKQVAAKLSCSISYVYKLQNIDQTFPRSLSIGVGQIESRGTRWVDAEVIAWLLTRKPKTTEVITHEDGRPSEDVHTGTGEEVAA